MRIRSTKPEFWRSKTIARFDWGTRLVLKGLESYVDDNGVGKDDIALIAADVFPRDLSSSPHETLRQLAEAVSRLTEAGLVVRYTYDGEDLIYIDRWKEWQYIQHPKAGRFCRPDGTKEYKDDVNPESYRKPPADCMKPPANCMTGTGEQGNRGTGEKPRTPVQTEQHSEPPPTPAAAATPGADLVREIVPNEHPSATLTSLRLQASELLNTGTDYDDVADALRLWCTKPGVGIGRTILSSLVSEVIKSRTAPTTNGRPHKMRTLAELTKEERAKEQAALVHTAQKEIS